MATKMITPKKEVNEVETETESPISSSTTTRPIGRRSAVEELQAKVGQFLEREQLIIEGKVPLPSFDDEDSDDEELSDSSENEKVDAKSILEGFREDSVFYHSAKHQCEWGGCQFRSVKHRKFMTHVERHATKAEPSESGSFVCEWQLCGFSAKTRDHFVGHVHYHAYHTKLKVSGARLIATLNIPVCVFTRNHRNRIPNDTNYECAWRGCSQHFHKVMDFAFHVDSHYCDLYANCAKDQKTPPKCQWAGCKASNRKLYLAKRHGQKHTGPTFIACDNCGHCFVRRDLLLKHCLIKQTKQNPSTPNYKCNEPGCGMEFIRKSTYERHMGTHYNRPASDFQCSICKKGFCYKASFSMHLKREHNVSTTPGSTTDDSSDDSDEEAANGTPKKMVTRSQADPLPRQRTPKTTLLNYFSSPASVKHNGTPERREIVTRGVKRRRSEVENLSL